MDDFDPLEHEDAEDAPLSPSRESDAPELATVAGVAAMGEDSQAALGGHGWAFSFSDDEGGEGEQLESDGDRWPLSPRGPDAPQLPASPPPTPSPSRTPSSGTSKRKPLADATPSPPKKQRRRATSTALFPTSSPHPPTPPPLLDSTTPIVQLPTPPPPFCPTEEEMDNWFRFVPPPIPPPAALARAPSPPRLTAAEKGKGRAQVALFGGELNGTAAGDSGERGTEAPRRAVLDEADPVHQLSPIPTLSASGHPLTSTEKRLAIINALERLALSILSQLVDSTFIPTTSTPRRTSSPSTSSQGSQSLPTPAATPPTTSTPPSNSKKRGRQSKPKLEPLPKARMLVVFANRKKKTTPTEDNEEPPTGPTSVHAFPRKSGSSKPHLNGPNLAAFIKTVELILDGLRGNVVATKRDLFYRSVKLFGKQARVDAIVEDIAATLQVRREDLNIVAAPKGLFAGHIEIFTKDGKSVKPGDNGALIPPSVAIERIACDNVKWVLVVEKEAVFQSLCAPAFLQDTMGSLHGVLLTGKGYPDLSTRELIKRLSDDYPSVPILCLVDADPHGLEILATYKHGSASLAFDRANLAVPSIEWIGVKGTEWDALRIPRDELLPLTKADRTKALKLLKREGLPDEWRRELSYMLHLQRKAEIQVLSTATRSAGTSATPAAGPASSCVLFEYLASKIAAHCAPKT